MFAIVLLILILVYHLCLCHTIFTLQHTSLDCYDKHGMMQIFSVKGERCEVFSFYLVTLNLYLLLCSAINKHSGQIKCTNSKGLGVLHSRFCYSIGKSNVSTFWGIFYILQYPNLLMQIRELKLKIYFGIHHIQIQHYQIISKTLDADFNLKMPFF